MLLILLEPINLQEVVHEGNLYDPQSHLLYSSCGLDEDHGSPVYGHEELRGAALHCLKDGGRKADDEHDRDD